MELLSLKDKSDFFFVIDGSVGLYIFAIQISNLLLALGAEETKSKGLDF